MWIRVEGGGSDMWIGNFVFSGLFKAYLVVFGLFLTKTEEKKKILIANKKIYIYIYLKHCKSCKKLP